MLYGILPKWITVPKGKSLEGKNSTGWRWRIGMSIDDNLLRPTPRPTLAHMMIPTMGRQLGADK